MRGAVARLFRSRCIGELDAVALRNVVVIGTARPMKNARPEVASYGPVILLATRDSMIAFIEAERALRSVSKILRLDRMSISP